MASMQIAFYIICIRLQSDEIIEIVENKKTSIFRMNHEIQGSSFSTHSKTKTERERTKQNAANKTRTRQKQKINLINTEYVEITQSRDNKLKQETIKTTKTKQ